jgi:hypothetical protein
LCVMCKQQACGLFQIGFQLHPHPFLHTPSITANGRVSWQLYLLKSGACGRIDQLSI